MKKDFTQKHTLLFYQFFFLYSVFILLTLFGLLLPLYSICSTSLKKSIEQANYRLCTVYGNEIDNRLKELDNNILSLSVNQSIYDFAVTEIPDGVFSEQALSNFYGARKAIKQYADLNSDIGSLCLYSMKNDFIIHSDGTIQHLQEFLKNNRLPSLDAPVLNQWIFFPDTSGEGKLYFIKKAMPLATVNYGYLIVSLSADQLVSSFPESSDYIVEISDAQDNLILQFFNHQKSPVLQDIPCLTTTYTSDYSGLQYRILTPQDSIMEPIHNFGRIAAILGACVFSLSLLLAFYFSKLNYTPIRSTADSLTLLAESKPLRNELDSIISAAAKLKADISGYKNVLGNANSMESVFIRNLIQGIEYSPAQLGKLSSSFHVVFDGEIFILVILTAETFLEGEEPAEEENHQLTYFAVMNILNEILMEDFPYLTGEYNGESILLLNLRQNALPAFYEAIQKVHAAIKHYLGISLSIGISLPVEGINAVKQAYKQACRALDSRYLLGKNRIFDSRSDAPVSLNEGFLQLKHYESKLINFTMAGDFPSCKLLLEDLKNELKTYPSAESDTFRYHLFTMSINILLQLEQANVDSFPFRLVYSEYFRLQTIDDYCEWFFCILSGLGTHSLPNKTKKCADYVQDVIQYINFHYTDELSLNMLADLFGLSPSYLSTMLNKQLHMSLTVYINRLRIAMAKELLLEKPGLLIQDIAAASGYNSIHTFLRAFKKEEGITPNQFREFHSV